MSDMRLIIPGRMQVRVSDLAAASRWYADVRDESLEGTSTFPEGRVERDGETVARVSYNAKIWPAAPWALGLQPIYDPYAKSRP